MTEWNFCPQCAKPLIPIRGQVGDIHPTCPDGHYIHYDNPKPVAGAVIQHGDKYLVLQRNIEPSKGQWELCGGFINVGETARQAVRREIKEELGVEGTIIRYIGSFTSEYGDTGITVTGTGFLVELGSPDIRPDPQEVMDYRWVDRDGFPPMAHQDDQGVVNTFLAQTA